MTTMLQVPHTRGAVSGVLLVLLGAGPALDHRQHPQPRLPGGRRRRDGPLAGRGETVAEAERERAAETEVAAERAQASQTGVHSFRRWLVARRG